MTKETNCPIEQVMEFLSHKWILLILKVINEEKIIRYNKIEKRLLNVSPRTLSKRLKELESKGIINKKKFNEIPPRVEYSLTKKGEELLEYFVNIDKWVTKWKI